jgi:hypothetical protein
VQRADARAINFDLVIAEIQASGVTTLRGISAVLLIERGMPTYGEWKGALFEIAEIRKIAD